MTQLVNSHPNGALYRLFNDVSVALKSVPHATKNTKQWGYFTKSWASKVWNTRNHLSTAQCVWNCMAGVAGFGNMGFNHIVHPFFNIDFINSRDSIIRTFIKKIRKFDKNSNSTSTNARSVAQSMSAPPAITTIPNDVSTASTPSALTPSAVTPSARRFRRGGGTYTNTVTETKLLSWDHQSFMDHKAGKYMYAGVGLLYGYKQNRNGKFIKEQNVEKSEHWVTNANINRMCCEMSAGEWKKYSLSGKWRAFYIGNTRMMKVEHDTLKEHIESLFSEEERALFDDVCTHGFVVEQKIATKKNRKKVKKRFELGKDMDGVCDLSGMFNLEQDDHLSCDNESYGPSHASSYQCSEQRFSPL